MEIDQKVVQDCPKVLPNRSWIDPQNVKKLENLVRDRAQNDLWLTQELPRVTLKNPTEHWKISKNITTAIPPLPDG